MSTKRVILANNSRLLREMLHRVLNKTAELEVVQELADQEELPSAIERLDPAWVIVSSERSEHGERTQRWLDARVAEYPAVRFLILSTDYSGLQIKSQLAPEEDLTDVSLQDFIQILERDLQHT
jgi:DNA-binding NarL/FixJ family response regulator